MLPTFSLNVDTYGNLKSSKWLKLLKAVNKSEKTQEFAGETFIKMLEYSKNYDLEKYANAMSKYSKLKRDNNKDVHLVTEDEMQEGFVGLKDLSNVEDKDAFEELIFELDRNMYKEEFLDVREKIFFDDGVDLWRLIILSKKEDKEAQVLLGEITDKYGIQDIIRRIILKKECYMDLEMTLC